MIGGYPNETNTGVILIGGYLTTNETAYPMLCVVVLRYYHTFEIASERTRRNF